jgi:hypothetical protein
MGRPGITSWSLPKAMFEPQKEIEPTMAAKTEKIATYVGTPPTLIEMPLSVVSTVCDP